MVYCDADDVRSICDLTTSDKTDNELNALISNFATPQLNRRINTTVKDERIEYISSEKKNEINGTNTTFYTKFFPLADYDNSGSIGTGDVEVYKIDSTGTRTNLTVSSIDDSDIGKITLSTAPESSDRVYFRRYAWCVLDQVTPHPLIKLACAQLTASLAYTGLDEGTLKTVRIGKISTLRGMGKSDIFHKQFLSTLDDINAEMSRKNESDN